MDERCNGGSGGEGGEPWEIWREGAVHRKRGVLGKVRERREGARETRNRAKGKKETKRAREMRLLRLQSTRRLSLLAGGRRC